MKGEKNGLNRTLWLLSCKGRHIYTCIYNAPRSGGSPWGDASWHAVGRPDLKREVVNREHRGLRVSDDIYQSSDGSGATEQPGVGEQTIGRSREARDQARRSIWAGPPLHTPFPQHHPTRMSGIGICYHHTTAVECT